MKGRSVSVTSTGVARGAAALLLAVAAGATVGVPTAQAAARAAGTPAVTASAADTATVVSRTQLGPREFDLVVHSPSNNKDIPVRLLVPGDWSPTATRTWPVLYMLHGGNDDYTSWTRETDIEELSAPDGVLIVMPDAGRDGTYSDWFTLGGPGAAKWETFHLVELWNLLRGSFRAGPVRGVGGLSSGGLGAMMYATRHPGMFAVAAAYSPPLNLFNPAIQGIVAQTLSGNGDNPDAIWGPLPAQQANWAAHDPITNAANLRGTAVFMSSGLSGVPGPLDPNNQPAIVQFGEAIVGADVQTMAGTLIGDGIRSTVHQYVFGTHSWPYWQRELHRSWPQLMTALGVQD
jgi:diacylglycerol O-acyltransferase / trehalose O-mycolyltransferase